MSLRLPTLAVRLPSLLAAIGLGACTFGQVDCGDGEILAVAEKLIRPQLQMALGLQVTDQIEFRSIRQTRSIAANGGSECAAQATMPSLGVGVGVTYTGEPTQDGNIYVRIWLSQ